MSGLDEFNQKQNKGRLREIVELVLFFAVMVFVFMFLLMSVRVKGASMNPNYVNNERGIVLRTNPLNKPKMYSVVVASVEVQSGGIVPVVEKSRVIKRVVALPGNTIEIKDNYVYVNGEKIEDNKRSNDTVMDDYPSITLADDEYFLLGDNRNNSQDSRSFGPVMYKDIEAVNGIVYWPINKVGLMN